MSGTYDSQIPPIEQVGESLGSIALDDALASVQTSKIEHVLGELIERVLQRDKTTVHDVNTVTHRVHNVLLHETSETLNTI
jgi:hypothetical protein